METLPTRRNIRRRVRFRQRVKQVFAAVAIAGVSIAGLAFGAQGASAASQGTGWGNFNSNATAYKGTFTQDGFMIICGQPGADLPRATLIDAGIQTSYMGISGNQLAGINRVVTENVGTGDKNNAAALEYAVARVVDPAGAMKNWSGGQMSSYDEVINYDLFGTAGAANVAAVQARANELVNQINSTVAGTGTTTGSGSLVFTVDGTNNYNGTVEMDGTPGSTGSITLTNGVFVSNNSATLDGAVEGTAYQIKGVPPTDDGAEYKIEGTGSFIAPGGSGYAANIRVWNPSVGGQQVSLSPGTAAVNNPFTVSGFDPMVRGSQFLPVLSTTASTFVDRDQPFSDVLTFSTAADDNGVNNNWYQSGRYIPVTAKAVIYGPFAEQPAESADAPADAPIAGTATVTTDPTTGPTVQYTVNSDDVSAAGGYYTWQWSIDWADQIPDAQRLIPGPSEGNEDQEPYVWKDAYGQVVESSVTPMRITATTQVKDPEVALSGVPGDTAQIDNDGFWLKTDGENVPVTVNWDAYYDAGTEEVEQVPASEIPADAELLGRYTEVVTDIGKIETPDDAAELGFTAPASTPGFIVWVLSIDSAENNGMVESFSDDYGVPSEIQKIAIPTVTTQATPGVKYGEVITDTGIVEGKLPANGAQLSFELYEVPMVENADGTWSINGPEGTPAEDLSWVCTAENSKFSNVGTGQVITEAGNYTSPEFKTEDYRKYLWVESLWTIPTEGGEPELIARGECGLPNETSFVFDVTTKAQTSDVKSTTPELGDTAIIKGYIPENGTITFEAYRGNTGVDAVCTDATRIWTSEPITLKGGLNVEGLEITSPVFKPEEWSTTSNVYFIEVTRDATGRIVSQGVCGEPDETVTVAGNPLIKTGEDGSAVAWIAGGSAAVLLAGAAVFMIARRRNATNIAE